VRRALIAAASVAVTCVALAAPGMSPAAGSPPVRGVPISRCTAHTGTIIAVDFAHWGGPIVRGCTLRQTTGYRLLHSAGFTTAGDQHDGPAFICRFGDTAFHRGTQYPTTSQEDCILTPPASAYWSAWLAPAGQNHWSYSQLGAMSEAPKAGEVELWTFGGTNIAGNKGSGVPQFTPDQLRSSNDRVALGSGEPRLVDALPTKEQASSGSAAPLVIGICVALALCAGAGWTVWRRRRYE
jgi:hypothetical protein